MRKILLLLAIALLVVTPLAAASKTQRANTDATRLASLLHDAQANVNVSGSAWRTIANEANTLANRMHANTTGAARTAARDARMHVRMMRDAALKGDAAEARKHAGEAMPFVTAVINATEK